MVAGHLDMPPVQCVREGLRGLIVPLIRASQDEGWHRDRHQLCGGRVHPGVERKQQRLWVTAGRTQPVLRLLLVAVRLESASAARAEELPVPPGPLGRVQQRLKPIAGNDRSPSAAQAVS